LLLIGTLGRFLHYLPKRFSMSTNNKPSMNQQDHPHREGQQNNTAPQGQGGAGQRMSENNSQQLSDMMNESDEQKAGGSHGQQDEQDVQQEERQP
jgi:hypothetical protein